MPPPKEQNFSFQVSAGLISKLLLKFYFWYSYILTSYFSFIKKSSPPFPGFNFVDQFQSLNNPFFFLEKLNMFLFLFYFLIVTLLKLDLLYCSGPSVFRMGEAPPSPPPPPKKNHFFIFHSISHF